MADNPKKKKVTRTMKVTMDEDEFEKYDKGITHSDKGLRDKKGKVNAVLELLIVLTALRIVDHVDQRFKVPFILRVHCKDKGNISSIKQFLRFHPKVIAGRLLRGRSCVRTR